MNKKQKRCRHDALADAKDGGSICIDCDRTWSSPPEPRVSPVAVDCMTPDVINVPAGITDITALVVAGDELRDVLNRCKGRGISNKASSVPAQHEINRALSRWKMEAHPRVDLPVREAAE
jgi:hypothetical protein